MRRRRKNRTGIGIIAFVVLCICGIVAYGKTNLDAQMKDNTKKKEHLQQQIIEEEERKTDLKNLEAYVQTKKYIEEVAREKLGLVYEYEIIFKAEE